MKKEEVNYKVNFIDKYLNKKNKSQIKVGYDILNKVDICISDLQNNPILYIESKDSINNENDLRKALAQTILTNHKQKLKLNKCSLIYRDRDNNNILKFIDCSDDSVLFNNDFNWNGEIASSPSFDAINRINDRLIGKIISYKNEEIEIFFDHLIKNKDIQINITMDNVKTIFNDWKNNISFKNREIKDEQEKINLFLADVLNGTKYQEEVERETMGQKQIEILPIIREGTNLYGYELENNGNRIEIRYKPLNTYYEIEDLDKYKSFWRKYDRPPNKDEFLKIIERSATLYTEEYRRTTGAEYTPSCFVELQNKMLEKYYGPNWKEEYIVFDPCAGVGNLQNDFGKEYKKYCYLSTKDKIDVDIMKIKEFENAKQYNYLNDDKHPTFTYGGEEHTIDEICKLENRKLMVIMNPPYQRIKEFKNNLAIEFFNKVLTLNPQVIVFYYKTENILNEFEWFLKSKYKIVNHNISNMRTTFLLTNGSVSQIIFDKDKGDEIGKSSIKVDRYEVNKIGKLDYIKSYTYNQNKSNLIKEIENKINQNQTGENLGTWCILSDVLLITNIKAKNKNKKITTNNLKYCLLSKGINFNTHAKYFEHNDYLYKGKIEDIPEELFNDSIMFSLFYKNNTFSNKNGLKNYIMPFTSEELGCNKNDLNILLSNGTDKNEFKISNERFDFREWFHKFKFSEEARDLYKSALKIFQYYHKTYYPNTNPNDSFYDITNIIMKKDPTQFKELELEEGEEDTRISQTKTTKGTVGFGRSALLKKNNEYISNEAMPIFKEFFEKRDILANKINKQLVESGLLLWERENIY